MKAALLTMMLCAASLLMSGCSAQIEERAMTDVSKIAIYADVQAQQQDTFADGKERVTLYFLSEDGNKLMPVVREIDVPGGVSLARAALEALLAGPHEGEDAFWPDIGLPIVARSLEISGGIAIVDLPARVRTLAQETLYGMRSAIANTLTELPGVDAVNVLIGGREEGFDLGAMLPVGTLQRLADLDVGAAYDRLDELRQSAGAFTQMTTVFLPTADGRYVLPQLRSVDYAQAAPIEYLYTLLEEIGLESVGGQGISPIPSPMLFIDEMPEIVRTEDGAYRALDIRFEEALDDALASAGMTRGIYMAMLTHTLMGVIPGVEGLKVHIGDEIITGLSAKEMPDGKGVEFSQVLATRTDFSALIGAPVTVYAIDEKTGGLIAEQRVLSHERAASPRALLETLLAMWGDRAETADLDGEDILAIAADGSDYVLNLSSDFAAALMAMEEKEAKAAVYAIVNTLTEEKKKGTVTFFFDGEQMKSPLGGIEMRGKLARNPGMVVD